MRQTIDRMPSNRSGLYYIGINTMVGLVTGVAFGVAVHNVIVGVILGFFIGSGVGATIYRKHRQETVDLDQILWASTPLLVFIGLTAIIWLDILAL